MKYNISDMSFSVKIVIILIVLLIYTFYFIDEELLVSLVTTLVLVGVYNMLSKSLNQLFMNDINDVFKKLAIYLIMNLTVMRGLAVQYDNQVQVSYFKKIYLFVIDRISHRINIYKSFFVNLVNFMYYNLTLYILSFNLQKNYFSYSRSFFFDEQLYSRAFSRLFNNNFDLKLNFLSNVAKILFR